MRTYQTLSDLVAHEVTPALGEYAEDFDVSGLVTELREVGMITATPAGFEIMRHVDEFWRIAERYDRTICNHCGDGEVCYAARLTTGAEVRLCRACRHLPEVAGELDGATVRELPARFDGEDRCQDCGAHIADPHDPDCRAGADEI